MQKPLDIEKSLKSRGLKITPARLAIMELFYTSPALLQDAREIYDHLRNREQETNFSTVYRNLELLVQSGLVEKVMLGNTGKYKLQENDTHRHHIICTSCHKTQPLPNCPLGEMESALLASIGFKALEHRIEVYGICKECSTAKRN